MADIVAARTKAGHTVFVSSNRAKQAGYDIKRGENVLDNRGRPLPPKFNRTEPKPTEPTVPAPPVAATRPEEAS